jgi:IS5 family transposase
MTAAQALRSLLLMRIKNWDYRELRERIADGYSLRAFSEFYSARVPGHDAFNRAFCRLTPQTLQKLNAAVVDAAIAMGLEDGKKLRVDTTAVESDIHYPSDSTLLWDCVRVITRQVLKLKELLPGKCPFTVRTRSARRRMLEIQRMTPLQRHHAQTAKYRELIHIARDVVAQARVVVARAKGHGSLDIVAFALEADIERLCGLADRVVDQAKRRVLEREQVPVEEKIVSIFEPHTDIIKRGKPLRPVEFGHKVLLAETAHGLITEYRVLDGNPSDEGHVLASLQHHRRTFGKAPEVFATDRGFHSAANIAACKKAGVKLVCIPQRGGHRSPEQENYEKTRQFKEGQRFRAGVEGRISVLFRGRGMKRCLLVGRERFELLVGAAVLANNLLAIAALLEKRSAARRSKAA